MKTPNNNIFSLIHSMTASEKRYFKMHFASERSLMTDLFDFINSLDTYDENVVKKNFSDSKLSKNLKVYKVQLKDLILKSLTIYHHKKNVKSKIKMELEEIDLLLNRQLFTPAKDKLKRLKKLCKEKEQFDFLLKVIQMELELEAYEATDEQQASLQALKTCESILYNINTDRRQSYALEQVKQKSLFQPLSKEAIQKYQLLLDDYLQKEDNTKGEAFLENCHRKVVIATLYQVLSQREQELNIRKNIFQLFQEKTAFQKLFPNLYWRNLYFYIENKIMVGEFTQFTSFIEKAKLHLGKHPRLQANYLSVYYLEILGNFKLNHLQHIQKTESNLLEHIVQYQQEDCFKSVHCFLLLTITYLRLEQPKKVHFYLRRLHKSVKQHPKVYARLCDTLELISHYETQDHLIIQNLISSYKRKQYYRKVSTPFFDNLINFFAGLIKSEPSEQAIKAQYFLNNLTDFKTNQLQHLLSYFIIKDWLNAIANGQTYAAYVRDNER